MKELVEVIAKALVDCPEEVRVSEEEREELEEAGVLKDISHMPARVKCAVLGWHTMEEMLNGNASPVTTEDK